MKTAQALGPCAHVGEPEEGAGSWLQTSSPLGRGHLGSEPADGISFCISSVNLPFQLREKKSWPLQPHGKPSSSTLLWPCPVRATPAIWEVKQQISPSATLTFKEIKKASFLGVLKLCFVSETMGDSSYPQQRSNSRATLKCLSKEAYVVNVSSSCDAQESL